MKPDSVFLNKPIPDCLSHLAAGYLNKLPEYIWLVEEGVRQLLSMCWEQLAVRQDLHGVGLPLGRHPACI